MLTSVSDYSGVITEDALGLTGHDYEDFIKDAIQRAYLAIRRSVPESTYNEAIAAFASGSATDDQLNLKWAEYWLTRYEIETARSDLDVVSERAGNLQITRDASGSQRMSNRFLSKARKHLSLAGFEWIGGDSVAGTRGGNPITDETPWFSG